MTKSIFKAALFTLAASTFSLAGALSAQASTAVQNEVSSVEFSPVIVSAQRTQRADMTPAQKIRSERRRRHDEMRRMETAMFAQGLGLDMSVQNLEFSTINLIATGS